MQISETCQDQRDLLILEICHQCFIKMVEIVTYFSIFINIIATVTKKCASSVSG